MIPAGSSAAFCCSHYLYGFLKLAKLKNNTTAAPCQKLMQYQSDCCKARRISAVLCCSAVGNIASQLADGTYQVSPSLVIWKLHHHLTWPMHWAHTYRHIYADWVTITYGRLSVSKWYSSRNKWLLVITLGCFCCKANYNFLRIAFC